VAAPDDKETNLMPRYPVPDPALDVIARDAGRAALHRDADTASGDPYRAQHGQGFTVTSPHVPVHSYFRDLLQIALSEQRAETSLLRAIAEGGRGGRDEGPPVPPSHGFADDTVEEARTRIAAALKRDLSTSTVGDVLRPSAPGYIANIFGQAARQVGRLADAVRREPLDPAYVDTSTGVPVVTIPRLSGGAAVASQASQNAAVQETDPTTAGYSAPLATVAGQVDMSTQLFELSRPGFDAVIANDLGRATGTVLDAQLVSGSGTSGQLRGLATVSGILTAATTATTAQAQLSAIWNGFNLLAGSTGFGSPDPDSYLTVMHPRRYAFLSGGSGGTGAQVTPNLPGQVVLTGGVRTNLGAGTNEDEVLIVDKSVVVLVGGTPTIRVFEEVGSGTLTVRVSSWANAALLVTAPTGIVRISGFPTPTF
jgi:hypothetical protein